MLEVCVLNPPLIGLRHIINHLLTYLFTYDFCWLLRCKQVADSAHVACMALTYRPTAH